MNDEQVNDGIQLLDVVALTENLSEDCLASTIPTSDRRRYFPIGLSRNLLRHRLRFVGYGTEIYSFLVLADVSNHY